MTTLNNDEGRRALIEAELDELLGPVVDLPDDVLDVLLDPRIAAIFDDIDADIASMGRGQTSPG